jgi:hypothetical protein
MTKNLIFFLVFVSHYFLMGQSKIELEPMPSSPDYSKISSWASHPKIEDPSDIIYKSSERIDKKNRESYGDLQGLIPTFFVYPTIYFEGKTWNADIFDASYRNDNRLPLAFQAAVFNDLGPIWAPHYRQMMYEGYVQTSAAEQKNAKTAYDTAYNDVFRAFKVFLKENPEGPFIVAGHSQGTGHLKRLIKEYLMVNRELRKRMLAAFLVGGWVGIQEMGDLPICDDPEDINCWMSWRSCGKDFKRKPYGDHIGVVNPLTWSSNVSAAKRRFHKGAMYPNGKRILRKGLSSKIDDGLLRIQKLKGPVGWFFIWEDYHRADYNLFWFNIRENIYRRARKIEQVQDESF